MPIITVQFIKDVVATPEQKRELVVRLTDTFVDILGEVVRPFVYCLIHETPAQEWAIAGVPMPDLAYLTGDRHAGVIERSNELMRQALATMAAGNGRSDGAAARGPADDDRAERIWRGDSDAPADRAHAAAERAEHIWQGELLPDTDGSPADGRPERTDADHAARHRAMFERWFEQLWNQKNYDIAYELVDPGFVAHGAGGQDIRQGPDGVVEMVKSWHRAMPDGRMTMDDIITEGDLSTIRMTWRGTHTGPFGDIPPSGKRIEVTSIGIDRVVDGKITEGWGELNMLGMLQQMGALPAPESREARPAATA